MKNEGGIHKKHMIWGLCTGILIGALECTAVFAGTQKSNAGEEAEACVREYYEAFSEGDAQRANELFGGEDREWREQTIRAMKENGMEKYDELEVDGYPVGDGEKEWLFVVTYEILAEGIETGMPGLEVMRARRLDGRWILNWNMTIEGELEEIWEKEGIKDKVEEWDKKYADAVEENEKISEWAQKVQDTVLTNILGDDSYVVEPGDCLWKIAAEQMGEGADWMELYECNRGIIGENPDLIQPGMRLVVP